MEEWRKIAGFLGEFGGPIGREMEAWKGAGFLEKKEGVLLWNLEEKIGGFAGERSLELSFLSGSQRLFSLLPFFFSRRMKRRLYQEEAACTRALEFKFHRRHCS